jgi:hypothetical protein
MSISTFTLLHVIISLVGICTGFVVVVGMLKSKGLDAWIVVFLASTALTDLTGYCFHPIIFDPAEIVGFISLSVLAVTAFALYAGHLAGAWRWIYVVGALLGLYLNTFVAVIQSFQKLAFLQQLAPTQKEPPFLIAQALVLAVFIVLGVSAVKRFRP